MSHKHIHTQNQQYIMRLLLKLSRKILQKELVTVELSSRYHIPIDLKVEQKT